MVKLVKGIAALAASVGLSACGGGGVNYEALAQTYLSDFDEFNAQSPTPQSAIPVSGTATFRGTTTYSEFEDYLAAELELTYLAIGNLEATVDFSNETVSTLSENFFELSGSGSSTQLDGRTANAIPGSIRMTVDMSDEIFPGIGLGRAVGQLTTNRGLPKPIDEEVVGAYFGGEAQTLVVTTGEGVIPNQGVILAIGTR